MQADSLSLSLSHIYMHQLLILNTWSATIQLITKFVLVAYIPFGHVPLKLLIKTVVCCTVLFWKSIGDQNCNLFIVSPPRGMLAIRLCKKERTLS